MTIRQLIRASKAPYWAAIAAWLLVDRAAHGKVDALPLAAILFAGGVVLSFVEAKVCWLVWRRLDTSRPPPEANDGAQADRCASQLAGLLAAAMCAVAAAIIFTPIEIFARAQPGDTWLLIAGRCAVHPVFVFVALLGANASREPPGHRP